MWVATTSGAVVKAKALRAACAGLDNGFLCHRVGTVPARESADAKLEMPNITPNTGVAGCPRLSLPVSRADTARGLEQPQRFGERRPETV